MCTVGTETGDVPRFLIHLYGDSPRLSRRFDLTSVTQRPLRADARRNYDALVQAALEVFAEQGTQGSLDDIAARAGVANATLYRRFPTREDLLVAALRQRMTELDEIAGRLSASEDPGAALEEWFIHLATHLRTWRGLPDSIARALSGEGTPLGHACEPLEVWTERLLARSTQTSFTRTDLDPHDVFTLVASLAWAADTRDDSEDDVRRMVHLVLEGLCVNAPQSEKRSSKKRSTQTHDVST
jgi:TetR/AcrR family transcriptional regulator, Clp-modulated transcription factor